MNKESTIAILDVGKTNKKIFLFDRNYNIVYQKSLTFQQRYDEDGYECEDLDSIENFLFDTLRELLQSNKYTIRAINFSTYGASLVHLGEQGKPIVDMFNYLKPYPDDILQLLLPDELSKTKFELETRCPLQGNLNSGLQLFRIYQKRQALFQQIKCSLHFPQYLSYLLTGEKCSDITSIGCHTSLWDFNTGDYHSWLSSFGIQNKLAPLKSNNEVVPVDMEGTSLYVGTGMHDSSAALVPYLKVIEEPFLLVSTGTWSITLHPFNQKPLTEKELKQGCLCYINYLGDSTKASRVFLGNAYEKQMHRIADFFHVDNKKYSSIRFEKNKFEALCRLDANYMVGEDILLEHFPFATIDLSRFANDTEAYYQLVYELVLVQKYSINILDPEDHIQQIFVDGGFGHNDVFMHMMALLNPTKKIYAAEVPQSTAIGAALVIHDCWNKDSVISRDLIQTEEFSYTNV